MNYIDSFFDILDFLNDFFWSYVGFVIICLSGFYLSIKSKGFQFKTLLNFKSNIKELYHEGKDSSQEGLHPFKLLFASVGGMVGIGNIVGVTMAVTVGGPGSIFWMWVASCCGMLIKYSEIYLGVKHRVADGKGSYNGGPMYYLQDVFKSKIWAMLAAFLLCIYGAEVFQFVTLVDRIEHSFHFDRNLITFCLIILTMYSVSGGMDRLSNICSLVMPFFIIIYIAVCIYIISKNIAELPELLKDIFTSAFTGHAAIGGFTGSTMLQAAYMGTSKAVYAGDIGVGYDSVVQSESRVVDPAKQARLSIYALCMNTFICTMSTLTVSITGAWYTMQDLAPSEIVGKLLGQYIPYSDMFFTLVLFFAGFTTIIAFFVVGTKAAEFISPKYGKKIYFIYGIIAFSFFSKFAEHEASTLMGVASVFLVMLNITAIIKMRNEIKF